jgi:hypothetical protein
MAPNNEPIRNETEASSSKKECDLEPLSNTLDWSFPWPSRDSEPQLFELCGESVYAFRLTRNVWSNIIFFMVVFGQLFVLLYLVVHVELLEGEGLGDITTNGWVLGMLILAVATGQHFFRGLQLIKLSCACALKMTGCRRRDIFFVGATDIHTGGRDGICVWLFISGQLIVHCGNNCYHVRGAV